MNYFLDRRYQPYLSLRYVNCKNLYLIVAYKRGYAEFPYTIFHYSNSMCKNAICWLRRMLNVLLNQTRKVFEVLL
jgi:hypothetical protein